MRNQSTQDGMAGFLYFSFRVESINSLDISLSYFVHELQIDPQFSKHISDKGKSAKPN